MSSYTSATTSTSASFDSSLTGGGSGGEKVTLRIQVVVEYDGPALSETGSIAESLSDRENGWGGGDNDGASERSSQWTEGSEDWAEGQAERDRRDGVPSGTRVIIEDDWDDESIDLSHDPFLPPAPERQLNGTSHPLAQSFGPSSSSSSSSGSHSLRLASVGSSPVFEGYLAGFAASSPSHDDAGTLHPADRSADWDTVADGNDDADVRTSTPHDGSDALDDSGPWGPAASADGRYTASSTIVPSLPSIDQPLSLHESRSTSLRLADRQTGSSSRRPPLGDSSSQSTASSAVSGLEQSEFGARWLKEQGEMLKKRSALPGVRPAATKSKGKQRGSASSEASDDFDGSSFAEGALALERAESGKWYYNYSAGSSRDSLGVDGDERYSHSNGSSARPFAAASSSTSSSSFPVLSAASSSFVGEERRRPAAFYLQNSDGDDRQLYRQTSQSAAVEGIPLEVLRIAAEVETGVVAPPRFAPDCSACGIRLTYMRYACTKVRLAAEFERSKEHALTPGRLSLLRAVWRSREARRARQAAHTPPSSPSPPPSPLPPAPAPSPSPSSRHVPSAATRLRPGPRTRAERPDPRGRGRGRRLCVRRHRAGRPSQALAGWFVAHLVEPVGICLGDVARLDSLVCGLAQTSAAPPSCRTSRRLRALRFVHRAPRVRALARVLQAPDRDGRLGFLWRRQRWRRARVPRDRLVGHRTWRVEGRRSVDPLPSFSLVAHVAQAD